MGCISTKAAPTSVTPVQDIAVNTLADVSVPVVLLDHTPVDTEGGVSSLAPFVHDEGLHGTSKAVDEPDGCSPSNESLDLAISPSGRNLDSAMAEFASSNLESSYHESDLPSTPGPIVSPNPGSPVGNSMPVRRNSRSVEGGIFGIMSRVAAEAPVAEAPSKPTLVDQSTQSVMDPASSPPIRSRLMEVSELRNLQLCLRVLGVWRSEILKKKVELLREKVDLAGSASELVLEENERLKERVTELENAIIVTNGQTKSAGVSVSTETMEDIFVQTPARVIAEEQGFLTPSSSYGDPPVEFITPPSARQVPLLNLPTLAELPASIFEHARNTPTPINIATPPQKIKSSWEAYLRPAGENRPPDARPPDAHRAPDARSSLSPHMRNVANLPARTVVETYAKALAARSGVGAGKHLAGELSISDSAEFRTPSGSSPGFSREPSMSKEKLREISSDLERLSESLAASSSSVFSRQRGPN